MAERCTRCRMHTDLCICAHIPQLELTTRVALVMHYRELRKPTATGPLALKALSNSVLYIHGRPQAPLSLEHLLHEGRRVLLLFPSEDALELPQALVQHRGKHGTIQPITLVVPDGNWRQASRIQKRVPGLAPRGCGTESPTEHSLPTQGVEGPAQVEHVVLPAGSESRWGIRTEPRAQGLATFEAIARALGIIEDEAVQAQLEALFERMVEAIKAGRSGDGGLRKSVTKGFAQLEADYQRASQGRSGRNKSGSSEVAPCEAQHPKELSILYMDQHLVAINKPSGVVVHRGWARDELPIMQQLRDQIQRYLYPVHRLDRATSGVLLFALSAEVARDMQSLFEAGAVRKRYLALCRGRDPHLRQVNHALAKEKGGEKREARTDFRLLGCFERYGLFAAMPRSGRTHQIRRHLKHAAHPIIGDTRYGKGEHNRLFRTRYGFHRLALHAQCLGFEHPRGSARVAIKAPLTEDFEALLRALSLSGVIDHD